MAHDPKIGIIVLNYNGGKCLPACLSSLDQLEYLNKDIIIIDNGSTDGSFSRAQQIFPYFTFIQNEINEGFAKGMNRGMRLALLRGARWLLLFNYDAEIEAQALSRLIVAAQKYPRVGLLSPVIYEKESGRLWFAKGKIEFFRMRAVHQKPSRKEFAAEVYPSKFLSGCALLINKELVDIIGFLDERFFLYYEDADYSLRAAQAGFDCLVVPKAKVWHSEVSKMNQRKTYFLVYSGLLFFQKHTPILLRPYMTLYGTMRRAKNIIDRALGRGNMTEEVRLAYAHFFHGH